MRLMNDCDIVTDISVINKSNCLQKDYIPKDLEYVDVSVDVVDEKKFMRRHSAFALREMFTDAIKDNCNLVAISCFRSYERQKEIYDTSIANKGIEHTQKYIAYPGTSEHQTGLAIDISTKELGYNLEEQFAYTKEGIWLANNCHNYGFIIRYPKGYEHITGYNYEPWHIRYVGKIHSIRMYNKHIKTLEEYIQNI